MRPSATARAQRLVAGMPPNEKKCGTTSAGAASASARTRSSGVVMANICRIRPERRASACAEVAHAAAAGIAHQRREAGRPDEPDAQPMLEAESAQPGDEVEDRAGIEAELGDDLDGKPGRLRGRDLFGKRAV